MDGEATTTRARLASERRPSVEVSFHTTLGRWPRAWRWESALAVAAVVAAVVAFWITTDAKFLAHPSLLAVQKANLILGPVFVGLYWHHRRPNNRLGLLLIALGLVGILYTGESSSSRWPFALGSLGGIAIGPLTVALILAFPTGRLDGRAERLVLAVLLLGVVVASVAWLFAAPRYTPFFSISGCRALCPADPLHRGTPSWTGASIPYVRSILTFAYLATAGLLFWRFVTVAPSRRRVLAIGAPVALCYLLLSATYQLQQLLDPHTGVVNPQPPASFVQWAATASGSAIWYSFLLALVATELFAGRSLRRLVRRSLGHPSWRELEDMFRGPLGDPGLRLGFWRFGNQDWADADGAVLAPPRADQRLTEVERDGRPAIAIVHDEQLAEDPELLQAVGGLALLSLENAKLDAAWKESLGELADSQARLVSASDRERRKLERDLHDGAQQRLISLQIKLQMAQDHAGTQLAEELGDIRVEATEAVEELRALAHGIYPPILHARGVADALRCVAMTAPIPISLHDGGIGRCEGGIEAAIYFCALEAIQNTIKHAGPGAQVSIRLCIEADQLHLDVRDNGAGFDVSAAYDGIGLQNMRDQIGAVGGRVEISSHPGQGALVTATARYRARREDQAAAAEPILA